MGWTAAETRWLIAMSSGRGICFATVEFLKWKTIRQKEIIKVYGECLFFNFPFFHLNFFKIVNKQNEVFRVFITATGCNTWDWTTDKKFWSWRKVMIVSTFFLTYYLFVFLFWLYVPSVRSIRFPAINSTAFYLPALDVIHYYSKEGVIADCTSSHFIIDFIYLGRACLPQVIFYTLKHTHNLS